MLVTDLAVTLELGAKLDTQAVPWVVAGQFASLLDDARPVADIDLVTGLGIAEIERFCDGLGPSYHVDFGAAERAARNRGFFTVIHNLEAVKVDLFCASDARSRGQLAAFVRRATNDRGIPVLTAEDLILQKLKWASDLGEPERHLQHALGVLRVRWEHLDLRYLRLQALAIGLEQRLEELEQMRTLGIGRGTR